MATARSADSITGLRSITACCVLSFAQVFVFDSLIMDKKPTINGFFVFKRVVLLGGSRYTES